VLPTHVRKARHDDRDELTGLLAGLPFPMAAEELMAVGVRLLLPPRILDQLGRLPRHMRFHSAAEVRDYVRTGAAPA
jgi:hypothetical protein